MINNNNNNNNNNKCFFDLLICTLLFVLFGKIGINSKRGKGKVRPRTGHEGPEGEQKYGPTLYLTSALDGGV